MTTDTLELPELPAPGSLPTHWTEQQVAAYTAKEMRAYATAAVLAERERCAQIAEDMDYSPHGAIASAIRNKE